MIKEEIERKGFVAIDNRGDKMTWNHSRRRVTLNLIGSFLHLSWNDEPIEAEFKEVLLDRILV